MHSSSNLNLNREGESSSVLLFCPLFPFSSCSCSLPLLVLFLFLFSSSSCSLPLLVLFLFLFSSSSCSHSQTVRYTFLSKFEVAKPSSISTVLGAVLARRKFL